MILRPKNDTIYFLTWLHQNIMDDDVESVSEMTIICLSMSWKTAIAKNNLLLTKIGFCLRPDSKAVAEGLGRYI
jgi:chromosome condensin MukBEF complex kleisin-like MukF subunit